MAQKIGMIAYNLARELLVKDKGGIASLPQNKEVLTKVQDIFQMLKAGGYNPISAEKAIKNTKDLKRVLTDVEMKLTMDKDLRRSQSEGIEEVMKKMEEGIPLNPSDQAKIEGGKSDEVLDAFKGFTPIVIQGGKAEGIEKLLKSGDVKRGVAPKTTKETIERKSMIDPKLTEEENIKNIMKENKAAAKRLEEKMKDPDKKAMGGRIEMSRGGGIIRFIKSLLKKKKSPSEEFSDYLKKMRAESDRMNKEFYEGLKPGGELDQNVAKIKEGYKFPDRSEIKKQIKERVDKKKLEKFDVEGRKPNAIGGRIEMNRGGGIFKFLNENNPFQAYKKYLQSVKKRSKEGDFKSLAPELGAVSAGGILVNRKMKSILEEGNRLQKEKFLKEYIEELNNDPSYKDRPELKDKLIENYTESLFGEKRATGGRIGFDKGSPPSKSRRNFLKLMGGLASIPIFGKLFKAAKPAAKVAEVAQQSGVPAYFPKLVDKIKLLGDDITKTTATKERQKVIQYKDYELTEEIDTGAIQVKKGDIYSGREEYMIYDKPETVIGKNNKPVEVPAQYEEVTVKPDMDGKMKDVDVGLDSYEEVLKEVRMKKAGGGVAYMLGE